MTKPIYAKKRSKLMRILLAPICAVVFMVGWCLYYVGESRQKQKQEQKPTKKTPATKPDEFELIVISNEEEEKILTT